MWEPMEEEDHAGAGLLARHMTPWRLMLKQPVPKGLYPMEVRELWERLMLEPFVKNHLLWQGSHIPETQDEVHGKVVIGE